MQVFVQVRRHLISSQPFQGSTFKTHKQWMISWQKRDISIERKVLTIKAQLYHTSLCKPMSILTFRYYESDAHDVTRTTDYENIRWRPSKDERNLLTFPTTSKLQAYQRYGLRRFLTFSSIS